MAKRIKVKGRKVHFTQGEKLANCDIQIEITQFPQKYQSIPKKTVYYGIDL